MTILIAYDGSDCAKGAIAELAQAGLPPDTQAFVVSAAEPWPPLPPAAYDPVPGVSMVTTHSMVTMAHELALQALADAQANAAAGAELVQSAFPTWTVQCESTASSAAEGILSVADQRRPDLIVVGSHGRSALGRMFMGSTSEKIARYAPCSVRVARPPADASKGPIRLLVAFDASRQAYATVDVVAHRAWPEDTKVRVVMVLDASMARAVSSRNEKEAAELVESGGCDAVDRLQRAHIKADCVLRQGDAKHVLVREAEQWQANCVFLGARGHSRYQRFLLGTVSASVVSRAHCSVEIVRRAESDA